MLSLLLLYQKNKINVIGLNEIVFNSYNFYNRFSIIFLKYLSYWVQKVVKKSKTQGLGYVVQTSVLRRGKQNLKYILLPQIKEMAFSVEETAISGQEISNCHW
jgi:hypothetical protein